VVLVVAAVVCGSLCHYNTVKNLEKQKQKLVETKYKQGTKNKNLPGPKRRLHRLGPFASVSGVTESVGAVAVGMVMVARGKREAALLVVSMSWQTCWSRFGPAFAGE
jgi:hypothetical protein